MWNLKIFKILRMCVFNRQKKIKFKSKTFFNPFKLFLIIINRINHKLAEKNLLRHQQVAIYSFDHIGLKVNMDGIYEKESLYVIFDYLSKILGLDAMKSMCAIDVGANIGNHSLFFSNYFNRVYSFEPNPKTFDLLFLNAKNAKNANIIPYNYGLGRERSVHRFLTSAQNIGGSKVVSEVGDLGPDEIYVDISKLDDLDFLANENIGLVKLDVEGFELDVVLGGANILRHHSPIILFEQHGYDFSSGKSLVTMELDKFGYRYIILKDPYLFSDHWYSRYFAFLMGSIFGFKKVLIEIDSFDSKFYDLIIAIPGNLSRVID